MKISSSLLITFLFFLAFLADDPRSLQAASEQIPAGAQAPAPAMPDIAAKLSQIDMFVLNQLESQNVPGYCLSIIQDGKLVFHKAYGYANLRNKQAATNQTVFGLASLTKTFTAYTLLTLVDKGLVGLDDPLDKYIKGLTKEYKPLTIRQLASMSAGVPKVVSNEVAWQNQIEILDHTPLVSAPGSQFLYSNFSYRLLGQVIENVSGRPYLEMVREAILQPFQMPGTATTVLLQPSGLVAQAYGDNAGRGPLREIEYKNPAISFSAGMLASTNDDLVNYVFGLLSRRGLSESAYRTLWYDRPALSTGAPCKWAFGWSSGVNDNYGGKIAVAMNGGTPGVASSIIIIPETNSAVIALSNLRKPPVYEIAKQVARMAFGKSSQEKILDEFFGADEAE